jgi:hypothetical protein
MLFCCSVAAVAAYQSTRDARSPAPPFLITRGREKEQGTPY